ncbi:hypothetical protein V8F20_009013 [Naviculisporaceae sp. PSN 640]
MDLLPHPKVGSGGVGPLEIPFVADTPYGGSSFWDFPQGHGFGDRWITLPATRLAALAQSWLFFGTISEFLGRQLDYRDFRTFPRGVALDDRRHHEPSNVTLRPLIPLLDEWLRLRKQESTAGGTERTPSWRRPLHLYQLATFLDKVFHLAEDFEQLSQGHIFPIPAIVLSVKILCITLSGLCDQVRVETGKPPPMAWPRLSSRRPCADPLKSSLPSSQLLLDMFQQHGWCPFQVGKITSTYNYAVAYYMTRIFQRFSTKRSHRGCSETECVAGNITDLDTYQPMHSEPSCRCRHLSVRTDQIRDIILQGGIPLVRVKVSPRKRPSIRVVRMAPWKTPFVAFSHVWGDTGLGNPRANSLPKCQLSRLQDWADNSGITMNEVGDLDGVKRRKRRYFWIDSLCIPAGRPADEARIEAINKIPAVFQAAERVTVLDEAFLKISKASTEPCELSARLSVSPWSSRCWTYLEASLNSERLEVRCSDRSFNPFWDGHEQLRPPQKQSKFGTAATLFSRSVPKESLTSKPLLERIPRQGDATIHITRNLIGNTLLRPLTRELRSSFCIPAVKRRAAAGGLRIEKPDLCTAFMHAWEELSKRSTTIPEDKHIILATLLGFNTQPVQRLSDPEDRMAAILGNMDGVPLSLFLSNARSRRGTNNGNNQHHAWIPLSPSAKTRLATMASSQYTNLRSDPATGDLYFPNNRISRREMSTLIILPQMISGICDNVLDFRVQDPSDGLGRTYTVRSDHPVGLQSSPGKSDSYCLIMKRSSQAPSSSSNGKGEKTHGALFRIQKISALTSGPVLEKVIGATYGGGRSSSSLWKDSGFGPSDVGLLLNLRSEYNGPSMTVRVRYECHVTVEQDIDAPAEFDFGFDVGQDRDGNLEDCKLLEAASLPPKWQMVLGRDGPPAAELTSHSPSYIESTSSPPILTTFLLTALDGLVAAGSVSMAFAICFTLLPLHLLSPLSSIAIVLKLTLHVVSIIQLLLSDEDDNAEKSTIYDMLHLITVAVYTISRVVSAGSGAKLSILDKVFIFWSFIGHTVNILARVLVTRYFVVPHLWHEYLAGFDGGHLRHSHNTESSRFKAERAKSSLGRSRDILSPLSDIGSDDVPAAETFLIPPWDSNLYPLSRQQASYGRSEKHRHQDFPWESPYDNEPSGTYPSPMDVYHPDIHSSVTPGRNKSNLKESQGLGRISFPAWSRLSNLLSLGKIMPHFRNGLEMLSSPERGDRNKDTAGIFSIRRKMVRDKQKQKQQRRKLRTDSMVVELTDTEADIEYDGYDRSSWRSGSYLLAETRSGR